MNQFLSDIKPKGIMGKDTRKGIMGKGIIGKDTPKGIMGKDTQGSSIGMHRYAKRKKKTKC